MYLNKTLTISLRELLFVVLYYTQYLLYKMRHTRSVAFIGKFMFVRSFVCIGYGVVYHQMFSNIRRQVHQPSVHVAVIRYIPYSLLSEM